MIHADVFHKLFRFDENSPTKLTKIRDGKHVPLRLARDRYNTIQVMGSYEGKRYCWSLYRVLFELYNGIEPPHGMYVHPVSLNKDIISKQNLILSAVNRL